MAEDNVDRIIRFKLDDVVMERKLVTRLIEDIDNEINAESPVGQVLLTASAGESFTVEAPGGDLLVEVLSVDGVHSEEICLQPTTPPTSES